MSKSEVREKIKSFFEKNDFSADDLKKIKKIAMKHKIKLGEHRKLFCKKCLSKLNGKTRIKMMHKTVVCEKCGYENKFKLS